MNVYEAATTISSSYYLLTTVAYIATLKAAGRV
jgi:hypothetical protein